MNISNRTALLVALAVVIASAARADEGFWPRFHGADQSNISSDTGLLKKWPAGGPPLLWRAKGLGYGYSTVAIADGRILTAGDIDGKTVVSALDMNGNELWQTPNGPAWIKPYPGTRGTPTIDGNHIYHESAHGVVACMVAETGKKLWRLNILEHFKSKPPRWALAESLLIDGNRVICCPGGPEASVVALDKKTGEIIWQAASTGDLAGYATPTLVEHEGMRIILTLTSKAMIGVNADNGDLLWRVPHESYADENVMMPLFHEGRLFVSTIQAGAVQWKINVNGRKASVEEVWRSKEYDSHHDGAVLLDGHIYGCSRIYNKLQWVCLDWKTGDLKHAEPGVGRGCVTSAEGLLYTMSDKGVMGLVRATHDAHKVISRFDLPRATKDVYWAHPVVCGGRLYIRHGEILYAYNIKSVSSPNK